MKYCPKCNFNFADFHHVCDFDGSELVPDPERTSLIGVSRPPRSRWWRFLKSPVTYAAVGLIAVLSSAFLIGYLDLVNQTKPIVKAQPSPSSVRASEQPSPAITTQDASMTDVSKPRAGRGLRAGSPRRVEDATRSRTARRKAEVARRTKPQASEEKQPVLTAMLKTTWHVLKRPFKF